MSFWIRHRGVKGETGERSPVPWDWLPMADDAGQGGCNGYKGGGRHSQGGRLGGSLQSSRFLRLGIVNALPAQE